MARFTCLATKLHLSLRHSVYMFNVFMLPRIELALHFVVGAGVVEWINSLDRLLIGCIKHLSRSGLMLSHTALALTLHLHLPSWMEVCVKVSEMFI